jgi:hypothetical protein
MLRRTARRLAWVAVAGAVLLLVRIAPEERSPVDSARLSANAEPARHRSPSAAGLAESAAVRPREAGGGAFSAPEPPFASAAPTASAGDARRETGSRLRLHVHAPSEARVGEVFLAQVDVEAYDPVGNLQFTVRYDKSRLALVGWSEGEFARQGGGASAELGVQEPSDGNIEVSLRVRDGQWLAGAASLVSLQFEAIKAGTSAVTLHGTTATNATGVADRNAAVVREGSIAIR